MKTKSFTFSQEKKLEELSQFTDINLIGILASKELSNNQISIIVQLLKRANNLDNAIEEYDEEQFDIEIKNIAKQIVMVSENDTEYETLAVVDYSSVQLTLFNIPCTFTQEQIEEFIEEQGISLNDASFSIVEIVNDLRYKI